MKSGTAKRIEARRVRRQLSSITPDNCLSQSQCPLFACLPPELRVLIFEFVLSPFEDHARPVRIGADYFRAGMDFVDKFDLNLLRTCRRIYSEASGIPMLKATIIVAAQLWKSKVFRKAVDFGRFTAKNVAELNHVHILDGPYDLYLHHRVFSVPQFRPKTISISCRFEVLRANQYSVLPDLSVGLDGGRFPHQLVCLARAFPDSLRLLQIRIQHPSRQSHELLAFLENIGPQYINLNNHQRLSTVGKPVTLAVWSPSQRLLDATDKRLNRKLDDAPSFSVANLTYSHSPRIPDWKDDDYKLGRILSCIRQ